MGKIFMSIGTIGISINWLFEGRGNEKYIRLKNLKWGPVILSFTFILYVIWLIQSTNYNNALNVLLIKLPLLSLPIVVGTSSSFNKKELKILLITFFSGLVLSSLISLMIYLEILPPKESTGDFRELSRTMHHIRYSLLIAISIIIALYLILYSNVKEKRWLIIFICWMGIMLILIPSMTGILACLAAISIMLIFTKKSFLKANLYIGFLWGIVLLIIGIYTCYIVVDYYQIKDNSDLSKLDNKSINGEKYIHNINNPIIENGNYVYINIAENECRNSWNSASIYHFDSTDKKGQQLKFTFYRYLASKGLKKDSLGFSKLTKQDIKNIEDGVTSVVKYSGYESRVREILLEIQLFFDKGQANNHSVSQRIIFFKAGIMALKKNFWFGVGPGGVKQAIINQYEFIPQDFDEKTKKKGVHNQFLSLLITFGIIGFLLFIIALIYPVRSLKKEFRPLYIAFSLIILAGFMSDDMLDRQAGVTIFIVINSILLFAIEKKDQSVLGSSKV